MSVIKVKKSANYTVIDNQPIKDKNLSLQSKGLITFLMSLPPNFEINKTNLYQFSSNGRDSTIKAFNELINAGYITQEKKAGSKFGFNYTVSDIPLLKNRNGKTVTENQKQISKEDSNKLESINKESKRAHKKNNFETSCFDGLTAEEKQRKKVAAKKESAPPAASACLQPFEMSIQGLRNNAAKQTGPDGLPLGWSAEIKKNFLYYCETMSFKKGGRWGSVRQIAELFDTINKYFIKYTAEEINDCLKYAANNSNTNFNPEFTRNRRNKDKQKGGAATAQNYALVKEQLNNPDFLNL